MAIKRYRDESLKGSKAAVITIRARYGADWHKKNMAKALAKRWPKRAVEKWVRDGPKVISGFIDN